MKTFVQLLLQLLLMMLPAASASEALVVRIHSHNDYEQTHPLFDALSFKIHSVEADVWYEDGYFKVSHLGWKSEGSLRELYLDPLQEIVSQRGSIFGDGKVFYLWIEFKQVYAVVADLLHDTLKDYPMLRPGGPVQVILTGQDAPKVEYMREYHDLAVVRDSNSFSNSDPAADGRWTWYALAWTDFFSWDGQGTMPNDQGARLKQLVATIHRKRRHVRFYELPETPGAWQASLDAGVDQLGADNLKSIYDFLLSRPSPKQVYRANFQLAQKFEKTPRQVPKPLLDLNASLRVEKFSDLR